MISVKEISLPLICLVLFLVHQIIQFGLGIQMHFFDSYLDPFLIMPIILALINFERKLVFNLQQLRPIEVLFYTLWIALIFEWIFPMFNEKFVGDLWDVIAYMCGSILFLIVKKEG